MGSEALITNENVREWFPAPRTENPLAGDPWWQIQGLGLFMALQILRLVPAGPEQQQALVELRRGLDTALLVVPAPPADEIASVFARTLAPWCPSPEPVVEAMLDLASLTSQDLLYDLGCGDGRIVYGAVARGARAVGIDIDAKFIDGCRAKYQDLPDGAPRPGFVHGDIMAANLEHATVITCYLVRASMDALARNFRALRSGTRIISHAFPIAGWTPVKTVMVGGTEVHLWVV